MNSSMSMLIDDVPLVEVFPSKCCKRRTNLEKVLIALVTLLLIVITVIALFLGVLAPSRHSTGSNEEIQKLSNDSKTEAKSSPTTKIPTSTVSTTSESPTRSVCVTESCVNAASYVLKAIDRTVDPCEDFYSYSCGGWIKDNGLLPGESSRSHFQEVRRRNVISILKTLESPVESDLTPSDAERKAKTFYESCLDVNRTKEGLGPRPLLALIEEVGGWALLRNSLASSRWNWRTWNFQDTLARIHSVGIRLPFFSLTVGQNIRETLQERRNAFWIEPSGLSLGSKSYNGSINSSKILSSYVDFMVEVSVLLGAQRNNETRNSMLKVLEFEKVLSNMIELGSLLPDNEIAFVTVSELQRTSPFIEWRSYLLRRLEGISSDVKYSETIILKQKRYFQYLSLIVRRMLGSGEDSQILHNYLVWQLIRGFYTYLSEDFDNAFNEFIREALGVTISSQERRTQCVLETSTRFPLATGAMFLRDRFTEDRKEAVETMLRYIRQSFKQDVTKLSWIDRATAEEIGKKVDDCSEMIGYPDYIKNITFMNSLYREIAITEEKYFENVASIVKLRAKENLALFIKDSWDSIKDGQYSLTQVNAAYDLLSNHLTVPGGFIQAPFFTNDFPKAISFGGMGMVLGHELTHGFDNKGRLLDKNGIVRPWWSENSVENYKQLTQCFVNQYSRYSIGKDKILGLQTLSENIADNGALKASFNAYLNWVNDHQREPPLPALNLTQEQLFFVSFAQMWCSSSSPSVIAKGILTDVHSPDRIRVIGAVSNSREFSQTFKCRPGQAMNPPLKCQIF